MEQELFFTGYCRRIDRSRMVCIVLENGAMEECDCCFGSCLYEPECSIAAQITEAQKSAEENG